MVFTGPLPCVFSSGTRIASTIPAPDFRSNQKTRSQSIRRWAQDCPHQSCAGNRIGLVNPRSTRRGAPSAPGRSCPRGRPASSARASARCATRRTRAPPRRRCRGASSRGAASLSCSSSASCRGTQSGLSLKALGSTSSLQGSWKPQAPHALAQERLHLGPGVPVLRALGADHPVPLRVEEVGLVRELQDRGGRVAEQGSNCRFTRCATCSSVRWAGCLVMAPPSSFTAASLCARSPPRVPPLRRLSRTITGTWTRYS